MADLKRNLAQGHAFISYAREDAAQVNQLQRLLENAGIRVWRDTSELWPGQDWRFKIRNAITSDSLVFIACFSTGSISRSMRYQNEELVLAIEQLRLRSPEDPWLIPVRFDDCKIPDRDIGAGRTLTSLQRVDFFGDAADNNAKRLVTVIRRLLAGVIQSRADQIPIELELIHTQYDLINKKDQSREHERMITLEARNRGDHALRIIGAGISSEIITFQFHQQDYIGIYRSNDQRNYRIKIEKWTNSLRGLDVPVLPCLIPPRDSARRFITDDLLAMILAIELQEITGRQDARRKKSNRGDFDPSYLKDVADAFDAPLHGWVEVSTGEYISSEPMTHDWEAAWKRRGGM